MQNRDLWLIQIGILIGSLQDRDRARSKAWPQSGVRPACLERLISSVLEEDLAGTAMELKRLGLRIDEEQTSIRGSLMEQLTNAMRKSRYKQAAAEVAFGSACMSPEEIKRKLTNSIC